MPKAVKLDIKALFTATPEQRDDEDFLAAQTERAIDELMATVKDAAYKIGGEFRGPGVYARMLDIVRVKART